PSSFSFVCLSFACYSIVCFSLGRFLERSERFIPESVQPLAQRLNPPRVHREEPPRAFRAVYDESCRLEDLQVLGYRGACHVHPICDLTYRSCAASQALQHRSPSWISQCIEQLVFVSSHEQ